jgi:UDP-glucose 4-epimerase
MTRGGRAGRRVVVTGATGNVGTAVVRALAADPAVGSVLGLARRLPRWCPDRTEWASADIASDDLVPLLRGADVVIHLAWLFQPTHRTQLTWDNNVIGGTAAFRAVASAGVPALVYASSVGAYSPGPRDRAVDERWPTDGWPTAGYTREKAYLERVLDAFEREHPKVRVVRMRPGFIFQQRSASQQRRLFAGPLVPGRLARPGLIPVVPGIPGLRFQALHAEDAAQAYRLAALGSARGAFNLAADPVVDPALLAQCLGARVVPLPAWAARAALSALWGLRLVPASPQLFDAVLRLPLMDTTRARTELGWVPRHSSQEAISAFLRGLQDGRGMDTPPLAGDLPGGRGEELAKNVTARR